MSRALWARIKGPWADRSVMAFGWDVCGCPPHSPSSWEILSLLPSLSFSFGPCCPHLQEYIRRQLEEEQRQLEILQQQLLQEQALLLVNGRPRPRFLLSAHVVSACALVAPVSPECLLPCRDLGDAAVTTGAFCPARWPRACLDSLAAASGCVLRNARLSLHPFRSVSMSGAAPLCCCVILKAVGSMLECGHTVMCLHLANPACPVGLHIPSEGFCFGFLAGTLYIPSPAVCILDILVFYLIYC